MGLEPTTPCLQSRCSSQLSYVPLFRFFRLQGKDRSPITQLSVAKGGLRLYAFARVRRRKGSAIRSAWSANRITRPAAPGVVESMRLPITASVMSAAICDPTATRRPGFNSHGCPMMKLNLRPVRKNASNRSPTRLSYSLVAVSGFSKKHEIASMPDSNE